MALDLSFGSTAFPRALEARLFLYDNAGVGIPARFWELDRAEAFYKCMEYSHHEYDWSGYPADMMETISAKAVQGLGWVQPAAAQNVRMKRPTAPLRLCPTIVDRFTGLLFSRERTPTIAVEGDEQSEDFLQAVARKSKLWGQLSTARTYGGAMGSVLMTVHLDRGRFHFQPHNPKTVHSIVWADSGQTIPRAVLIQYPIFEEEDEIDEKSGQPTGRRKSKQRLYRRIIDEEWDLVFKTAPIEVGKIPGEMEPDMSQSIRHGLGFFPGVWIRNLPSDDGIDGVPDCDGAYQMFDTIDRIHSQANRGLLANMDPTLVISPDAKIAKLLGGAEIKKGSDNALDVGPGGSASYLEIDAAGITAGLAFADRLKEAAMDRVQCVMPDPDKVSGAASSAEAIKLLFQPMFEKADRLREQYGEGLEALLEIVLRMARDFLDPKKYQGQPDEDGVRVGNPKPYFQLPPKIVVDTKSDPDAPQKQYIKREPGSAGGVVVVKWGPFLTPTPTDKATEVITIANAKAGGLIDEETAIRQGAPLFGVRDVDGLIQKLNSQHAEAEKKQADLAGIYQPGDLGGKPPAPQAEKLVSPGRAGKAIIP